MKRLLTCYATIAVMIPYLTLKALWITGHPIGFTDAAALHTTSLITANLITGTMEAIGLLTVLALTYPWGRRIPTWLIAFPLWVGTGLLTPIAIGLPISALANLIHPGAIPTVDRATAEPWLFPVVYGGFTLQGIGLLTAFTLHARDRWPRLFTTRTGNHTPGPTQPVARLLANTTATLAVALAAVHFYWATGHTQGLPADRAARQDFTALLQHALYGTLALTAAAGILAMIHQQAPRTRHAVPLTATWIGAAATFTWGIWFIVPTTSTTFNALQSLSTLTGALIGVTAAYRLTERH